MSMSELLQKSPSFAGEEMGDMHGRTRTRTWASGHSRCSFRGQKGELEEGRGKRGAQERRIQERGTAPSREGP